LYKRKFSIILTHAVAVSVVVVALLILLILFWTVVIAAIVVAGDCFINKRQQAACSSRGIKNRQRKESVNRTQAEKERQRDWEGH